LTIKLAESEDFQRVATTLDKYRTSSRIADRTGRGDVCVVAYKHDALAHVRWAARTPMPLKEYGGHIVHLAFDEAFLYDSFTLPAFRGYGISSEARSFLCNYLAQHDFRCAYATNRIDNVLIQPGRIKRVREGRVRILGQITVITRLGRTHCMYMAESEMFRSLIARLFQVPLRTVHIR
jgi:hypothetical protein